MSSRGRIADPPGPRHGTAAKRAGARSRAGASGLAAIAGSYGGFIIDLWGVIHDGQRPHAAALGTLRRLRARGAAVCFLSNTPRRAADLAHALHGMGVGPALYDHLVTSGEVTLETLLQPGHPWHPAPGSRYLHLGPPHGFGLPAALPYAEVDTPATADFVLATGTSAGRSVADHGAVLAACVARGLPMVCANPDLVVHVGRRRVPCAGALGRRYARLGGEVRACGKPHGPVYRRCLARLGLDPRAVLAIGDGIQTDVAGAAAAGIAVAFVAGGVHRDAYWPARASAPAPDRLAAFLAASGQQPTFVLPRLAW